jgi:hypothetical protein
MEQPEQAPQVPPDHKVPLDPAVLPEQVQQDHKDRKAPVGPLVHKDRKAHADHKE